MATAKRTNRNHWARFPSRVAKVALLGPAVPMTVSDALLEAAKANHHVAYELVHWVRVRTPDDRAKAWLLAGETALDGAIHAPTGRSAGGVGLAAWQDALAAVQPV